VRAARAAPGNIATLILPADTAWNEAAHGAQPLPGIGPQPVSAEAVDEAVSLLRNGKRTAILMRGGALRGAGLEAAGRVAAKTGARLMCDTFAPRTELGAGRVAIERLPYFAEQITEALKGTEQMILVGAKPPVSFFAYPNKPSWCSPEGCRFAQLAHEHEDAVQALEALDEALGGTAAGVIRMPLQLPDLPTGRLTAMSVAQSIAHLTPERAIYADESATSGLHLALMTARARPHDHLALTGGSIGLGLPLAVGAAIACPDRKVVCPHGDGGAAYTLQALWTMAREKLDVTTVIYANRSYAILNFELMRVGASGAGPKAMSMLDLHNPEIN
jgi:acetolactate synthase-1/2/3 large subunit